MRLHDEAKARLPVESGGVKTVKILYVIFIWGTTTAVSILSSVECQSIFA